MKLAVLAALTGCSHAATNAPPAPPISQHAPPDAAAPAPVVDDDLEGHVEHDHTEVAGLGVSVARHTMTGNTHVAQELDLVTPSGSLHFAGDAFTADGSTDPLRAEALPLAEVILPAGPKRWIVLAWSSFGEGMQSEHVWLVAEAGHGPRVVDSLVWETDRAHAGLALDPQTLRVGVPLPDPRGERHNGDWWRLRHDRQVLAFDKVTQLPAHRERIAALPHYTPPFDAPPAEREWSGSVVWFVAAGDHFTVQP